MIKLEIPAATTPVRPSRPQRIAPLDSTPALGLPVEDEVEDELVDDPVEDGTVTADAAPLNPPCTILGATVSFTFPAALANMSTVFDPSAGGLMTPTIPPLQWPGNAQ